MKSSEIVYKVSFITSAGSEAFIFEYSREKCETPSVGGGPFHMGFKDAAPRRRARLARGDQLEWLIYWMLCWK